MYNAVVSKLCTEIRCLTAQGPYSLDIAYDLLNPGSQLVLPEFELFVQFRPPVVRRPSARRTPRARADHR